MTWRPVLAAALLLAACGSLPDEMDLGPESPDLGRGPVDDAVALTVDEQLQAIRDAAPGVLDPGLPVGDGTLGPLITYLRDRVGDDPAGFFVQNSQDGPALFVAIAPGSLPTPAAVGDMVSFTVRETAFVGGQHRATAIVGYERISQLNNAPALAQDVSSVDLPARIDDLESELVELTASVVLGPEPCGLEHECFSITTAQVTEPTERLQLRVPTALNDSALFLSTACMVAIGPTPLWRTETVAQPLVLSAEEIDITCDGLRLIEAEATSSTTIVLRFNGAIDPGSIFDRNMQFFVEPEGGGGPLPIFGHLVAGATIIVTAGEPMPSGVVFTVRAASMGTPVPIRGVDNQPLRDDAAVQTFTAP